MHDDIVSNVRENLHYLDVSIFNHILSGSHSMNDEEYMAEALKEAEIAMSEDEVPIGCIIVYEGQIIARTHNQKETLKKATGHAEILAINQASEYLDYCMQGPVSIPERVDMLNETKEDLERRLSEIQESLDYIEQKKELYRDMQEGKKPYVSYVYHVEN